MSIYDRWYESETDKVLTVFRERDGQEALAPKERRQPRPAGGCGAEKPKRERRPAQDILRGAMTTLMGAAAVAALLGEFQTAAACILLVGPIATAWLGYSL